MAEIAATKLTGFMPLGDRYVVTYRTAACGVDQIDEYIKTGLRWVDGVVGVAGFGVTGELNSVVLEPNVRTDAGAPGDNPGDLRIRIGLGGVASPAAILEVTVVGRA